MGLALLLVLVALVATMAYQGVRAAGALKDLQARAGVLQQQVRDGDTAGARGTARALRGDAATARSMTDNVLWDGASHLPWLGRDVDAVQVVSRAADEIAAVVTPALDLLGTVRGQGRLRTADGRIRLDVVSELAPRFARLSAAIDRPARDVAELRTRRLLGPLQGPVSDVQEKVAGVAGSARAGAKATRLLPDMLGRSGPRTYLLVVQNNAEIRATGGMPGAMALLRARDGRLTLGRQLSATDFGRQKRPVVTTTAEERALFGAGFGTDLRDFNLDPDFPRAAEMLAALVARGKGVSVDGVVALDPVALSEVMSSTGPVSFDTPLGTRRLTAEDVVPTLLHETYVQVKGLGDQDAFFAAAARGVFASLVADEQDPATVLPPVARAAGQRRVLVWSRRAAEQDQLAGTAVSGALPDDAGAVPHVGMYLNDGTAAKMDYYLRFRGEVSALSCTDRGGQDVRARVELRSTAPADVAQQPTYVTGTGQFAPRGTTRVNVRVYAPVGGRVLALRVAGRQVPLRVLRHDGHQVAFVSLLLEPGGRTDLEADVRTRAGQDADPVLRLTPGIESRAYDAQAPSACS